MNNMSWDQETKDSWLAIMREHQTADRFVQGDWLLDYGYEKEVFRGCFFGCAMQTNEDALYKAIKAMRLPSWLIYLAERIFEGLPVEESKLFPVKLLEAMPVDTDLHDVMCKSHILRLKELANKNPSVADAINGVIDCYETFLVDKDAVIDWAAARTDARSAARTDARSAESAAWSAAARSAESAAWSAAAWSAAWSAESAAESAEAATCSAETAEAWSVEADRLIELLRIKNEEEK